MCEILFVIQLEPVRQVLPFDWFTTDHLVSGESTLHWVTLFSARSRIFLPIAQSCAALFCCRLAIRASSLGWLVGNKASNIACRAELGRLPLLIPINQKIMNYFVYLNNKDNDSIVKQSVLMSKNLHSMNNSGYYSKFIKMFEQYKL